MLAERTGLAGKTDGRLLTVDTGRAADLLRLRARGAIWQTRTKIRSAVRSSPRWSGWTIWPSTSPISATGRSRPSSAGISMSFWTAKLNPKRCTVRTKNGTRCVHCAGNVLWICTGIFTTTENRDSTPGTPIRSRGIATKPNTRLHLILGSKSVAAHVTSACVDLKYRGPLEDLPGHNWAPCAPVIIEVNDDLM